jgi:GDPmannose 4,6-dehydratase
MKKVLITGITGQDGSYLAELLLSKGYEVHGIKRRASLFNTDRIDHIYCDPHDGGNLFLHYGDLTDSLSITEIIQKVKPDEIYNLAAQSHVAVSFVQPEYTANVDALGTLRILESVRLLGMGDKVRIYQASTSELFGKACEFPQNEKTSFYPRSPYGVAKLFAYWITVNYREAYGMYACNGILFNHESPRRGETFVNRKITRGVARILFGLDKKLYLGNLNARRDFGHAKDYVEGMYLILQQPFPDDYVLATGITTEIREFVIMAFEEAGMAIEFKGEGVKERGIVVSIDEEKLFSKLQNLNVTQEHIEVIMHNAQQYSGKVVVAIDQQYFRPSEVDILIGDASKAREKLGWQPKYTVRDIVLDMVNEDLEKSYREYVLTSRGFYMVKSWGV